jgi:hypothetical protein
MSQPAGGNSEGGKRYMLYSLGGSVGGGYSVGGSEVIGGSGGGSSAGRDGGGANARSLRRRIHIEASSHAQTHTHMTNDERPSGLLYPT